MFVWNYLARQKIALQTSFCDEVCRFLLTRFEFREIKSTYSEKPPPKTTYWTCLCWIVNAAVWRCSVVTRGHESATKYPYRRPGFISSLHSFQLLPEFDQPRTKSSPHCLFYVRRTSRQILQFSCHGDRLLELPRCYEWSRIEHAFLRCWQETYPQHTCKVSVDFVVKKNELHLDETKTTPTRIRSTMALRLCYNLAVADQMNAMPICSRCS